MTMVKSDALCPICEAGHLSEKVEKNTVEYKGHSVELDALYSMCDACGSEQASAAQTRVNKRAMVAFKKQVDGLLTGAEVRHARENMGVNQAQAAQIFGGGPVAFSKYENDDVTQSEAMDKLLRVAAAVPMAFDYLANMAGFDFRQSYSHVFSSRIEWETIGLVPHEPQPVQRARTVVDSKDFAHVQEYKHAC